MNNMQLSFYFLVFLICFPLFSQKQDRNSEINSDRIDVDIPRLNSREILWLETIIKNKSIAHYGELLSFLENYIEEGLVSTTGDTIVNTLRQIVLHSHSENGTPQSSISQREWAIRLLGVLGGENSLVAIDEILSIETNPTLLNSIFIVYRKLTPSFNTLRKKYFAKHLQRSNIVFRDSLLTQSILAAIESMHRQTWSMNDEALFAEILAISNSGNTQRERTQALLLTQFIIGVNNKEDQ